MKKVLKIVGIALLSIIGLIAFLIGVVYFSSKTLGYKKEVKDPIFQPSRVWVYQAYFYDTAQNCLDSQVVKLKVYDERFLIKQTKIEWIFQEGSSTTGVIENKKRIWLHPPRNKIFTSYTEFAGFPEIQRPLIEKKEWSSTLQLGSFATEESDSEVQAHYEVQQLHKNVKTSIGELNCTKIKSVATSGLGEYTHSYYFHEFYGFVSFEYVKSGGEKLVLKIADVEGF